MCGGADGTYCTGAVSFHVILSFLLVDILVDIAVFAIGTYGTKWAASASFRFDWLEHRCHNFRRCNRLWPVSLFGLDCSTVNVCFKGRAQLVRDKLLPQ